VEAAMQAGSRSVVLVTILAALASIFFALLLTYLLTRPLLDLHETAQDVSSGQLDSRAKVWANDEIGQVARSVNNMIDELVTSQAKLSRANQRLEAMNQVAMAAGRELALSEVLESILQGTLRVMKLDKGWVYLNEGDNSRFYLAHHVNLPPDLVKILQNDNGDGACTCQRDLLSGEIGSEAVVRSQCIRLNKVFSEAEPHTHISIPLKARGQVLGVINLLCPVGYSPLDADMELITAIGAQASEIVANAWLHARLVEKEAARKALLESLVRTQEDERKRLASELHDGAGQALTTLLVRLKTLEKQSPPGDLHDGLLTMEDLVSDTIEQIRELSYRLRPAILEEFGLALALKNLAEEMAGKAGLEVVTHFDLDRSLPSEVETAFYRIAQESLTNAIRHAVATRIEIELLQTPLGVCLRIEDDGKGFDPDDVVHQKSQPHLGLISIQERAEMLGGSVAVYSAPGAGTSVQIRIPILELEAST
jgi:signal transduction histidine kinase